MQERCEVLKQLKQQQKSAISEYSYFAYRENKTLRGISDRKSKQLEKEARVKMDAINLQISQHVQICVECKPSTE